MDDNEYWDDGENINPQARFEARRELINLMIKLGITPKPMQFVTPKGVHNAKKLRAYARNAKNEQGGNQMIQKWLFICLVSLVTFSPHSEAETWEPFLIRQAIFVGIDRDSIRSYPGVVFAVVAEKLPDINATLYKRAIYSCGSRELFAYPPSLEYPHSASYLEPYEPELVLDPKYQFEINQYCTKEKSREDIEVTVGSNEKALTTMMLSETKIFGRKVSLWTNNYQLTKKPEIHKGKQVIRNGQKQYTYMIDKGKGVTVTNNLLDCNNGTFISKRFIRYDGNGKVLESYSTPTDNMTPTPRTIGGQVFKFGCAFVK